MRRALSGYLWFKEFNAKVTLGVAVNMRSGRKQSGYVISRWPQQKIHQWQYRRAICTMSGNRIYCDFSIRPSECRFRLAGRESYLGLGAQSTDWLDADDYGWFLRQFVWMWLHPNGDIQLPLGSRTRLGTHWEKKGKPGNGPLKDTIEMAQNLPRSCAK